MVFAIVREKIQKYKVLIVLVSFITCINVALLGYQLSVSAPADVSNIVEQSSVDEDDNHDEEDDHELVQVTNENGETYWTCSMHPQIKLPKPGKCPICFMDLIPLEQSDKNLAEREVVISEYAKKLLKIETLPAERKAIDNEIRLVGKVDYDETRVSTISAWIPGRIDKLYVNYTGVVVEKGQHMASIYSPELLIAQDDLINAINGRKSLKQTDYSGIRDNFDVAIRSAREKLRLWGVSSQQIKQIERRGKVFEQMDIQAPISGVVVHKDAREGIYVKTGTPLFTVADLSKVWVNLDAYESDLRWMRYGAPVEFTTETYPDKKFTGIVTFIDPVVNESTRTARVRVVVDNGDMSLKPGMFVRSIVHSSIASDGKIINRELAGKWISPMHPEVIKDAPGKCDVCGMPLVSAESLGYVADIEENRPLVVPASAVLLTGKRAIVYVANVSNKETGGEKPSYEGRVITLGPRAGDHYLVKDGLNEGEQVVVRGAFKLDAELQLQARPSMMSEEVTEISDDEIKPFDDLDPEFRLQMEMLFIEYEAIHKSLSGDDPDSALIAVNGLKSVLSKIPQDRLDFFQKKQWKKHNEQLLAIIEKMASLSDLEKQRIEFESLTEQMIKTLTQFPPQQSKLYLAYCSMAFNNKGARWIQREQQVINPYYGSFMLYCGEIADEINFPAFAE